MNAPVVLRRRSSWEAADMGVLLWQSNAGVLFLFFGIPLGICAFFVQALPPEFQPAAGAVLWWILPLLDRFALQAAAVRFFEPQAPVKRLFKGLGGVLGRGLAGDLLWRRFSPFRSARMPIAALEKLKGPRLRRRKLLLGRNGLDFGFTLTLICLGLETVLGLGELAFIFALGRLFFPWVFSDIWVFLQEGTGILITVTWINRLLIESLYVCMGFGLYINSRVETEGWDIELLFKEQAEKRPGFSVKIPALLAALLFFAPAHAWGLPAADPAKPGPLAVENAPGRELLEKVLSSPDFGAHKKGWTLRLKDGEPRGDRRESRKIPELRELFGIILRAAAALGIAAALGAAVYFARKQGLLSGVLRRPDRARRKTRPRLLREIPADPRSLLEEAAVLCRNGKTREGWACCLRAFFAAFSLRGLELSGETTEYEALALVCGNSEQAGEDGRRGFLCFETFIRRWTALAYAGREPPEGAFEASLQGCLALIENWRNKDD